MLLTLLLDGVLLQTGLHENEKYVHLLTVKILAAFLWPSSVEGGAS